MTEEEKKEFEEFLQWKKEKQEREKLQSEELHKLIEETDKITGSHSEKETPKKRGIPKTIILMVLGFFLIVWLAASLKQYSGSKGNTETHNETINSYTEDPLKAIRDSILQASADSTRKAQRLKQLKNSVRITTARLSAPNSAGGVDAIVYYKNVSDKTIKYFWWEGYAKNAVGDIVSNEINRRMSFGGKDTGPVKPRKTGGGCWDCIIYNNTAKKLVITEVTVEYMDGSEIKIGENEIKYIK